MRDDILSRSVATLVPLAAAQAKPVDGYSEAELEKIFAEMIVGDLATLWFTMIAFGPAAVKALAMRWSLTDLDAALRPSAPRRTCTR